MTHVNATYILHRRRHGFQAIIRPLQWRGYCGGCAWQGPWRSSRTQAEGDCAAHEAALSEREAA